ncbi:MAG: DUF6311 domain-containing protein [Oscillospiraceae bacterium]|nr:DUF6311 domain-containing protein [Oscillospiraceae bacterium]
MKSALLNNHKNQLIVFIGGCILGIIAFGSIFGFAVVNPTYDDWIFHSAGDMGQHYLGWKFYRNTSWTFPFGLIDGLSSEGMISCIYTDSIPLLAVFFKLISPVLPETFQYIGLWELISYMLMGGLSALLVYRYNKNPLFCITVSIFYILAPATIARAMHHEALSGQWILILGLLLCAYREHNWKHRITPVILWTVLGILAVSIHIYFIPMIYMIMLGYILSDIFKSKKAVRPIAVFASTTFFSLIFMYGIGAFYGDGNLKAGGLGIYSANYNAFFNSYGYSKFLKPLNTCNNNSEGMGYLGLGMILLGFMSIIVTFYLIEKKNKPFLSALKDTAAEYRTDLIICFIVIAASMFLAASPIGTFNGRVIYTINYPGAINNILEIFRASGRFIWVSDYILFTAFLAIISKLDGKKTVCFAAFLCLGIQLLDLRDWFTNLHTAFASDKINYQSPVQSEKMDELSDGADEFIFLPLPRNYLEYRDMYYAFAEYACDNDMELSSFYLARADYDILAEYAREQLELLSSGNGRDDAVYVFMDTDSVPQNINGIEIYEIGGYTLAVCSD